MVLARRCDNPLVIEDTPHPSLDISILISGINRDKKIDHSSNNVKYDFRKGYYIQLHARLAAKDWSDILSMTDINAACEYFYNELFQLLDESAPKCLVNSSSYPVWFPPAIISDIRLKHRCWKRYKKLSFSKDLAQINLLRKRIKIEINKASKNFISISDRDIKTNPKSLWTYINLKKNCISIPGVISFRNPMINSPQDISNSFVMHFSSVFVYDNTCDEPNVCIVIPFVIYSLCFITL
ncbi:hypothetical protein Zmor_021594 [Zophobas morio]|uniref:Uncharacterized protein n=1 Tax=Zophobas morio TaxID=2755281 RepID=A0AA38I6F3_9CUCU|nr:hypothetical protein Zmor_021594 [Zophobas morio]